MPGEKVLIPCHDSVVSANIPAKMCQHLIDQLPDDYAKTGQLMKSLTVVVGMIVVHTANVDVEIWFNQWCCWCCKTHWLQNERNRSS